VTNNSKILLAVTLLLATYSASGQSLNDWIDDNCDDCSALMAEKTGAYILEKGEEALMGRAWLTQHAQRSIDIQYFIWSTDNIGILAAQMLLEAANRGVVVRVLVDDFLIDAQDQTLLLLSAHENVHIRIYNPKYSVGTSLLGMMSNAIMDFRGTNQRMHDKTAIFDNVAGITGGRNMADEYFDFDPEYNFRDRDILLLGPAVVDMTENFDEFWDSPLAVPVEELLDDSRRLVTAEDVQSKYEALSAYASNPANFDPSIRDAIDNMPAGFPALLRAMAWHDVEFISDAPGKNTGEAGLGGGGESTSALIDAVRAARHSVLIQSPYLILPKGGIELLGELLVSQQTRYKVPITLPRSWAILNSAGSCSTLVLSCMSSRHIRKFRQTLWNGIRGLPKRIRSLRFTPKVWLLTTSRSTLERSIWIRARPI
jgi:phosphatidylserine/phosphatidylglycerophosphate/cardiolipin synthase-like enzyme